MNHPAGLRVTLSLAIIDEIDKNGITSWFYREDLTKYLKIRVIQSTHSDLTDKLSLGQLSALREEVVTAHTEGRKPYFTLTQIPVKKMPTDKISDFIKLDTAQDKRVFSINYDIKMDTATLNQVHLSYFAFCYLDLQALVDDYDLGFININSEESVVRGNMVGEKVIIDKELQLEAYTYLLDNGQFYTGPVHQMPGHNNTPLIRGRWMTGVGHTDNSRYLTRRKVANTKIQDFRDISTIQEINFDLTPADNLFAGYEKGKRGSQRVIQNAPDVYFSDAFISHTQDGDAKFLFQLDYNRIIRDKSQFGNIIDKTSNSAALTDIYKNSNITLLKIVRRRVRLKAGTNKIGSPVPGKPMADSTEPETILLLSADDENGILKTVDGNRGAIKEITLTAATNQKQFRTFIVTDKTGSDVTDGLYQYGVVVEMRDGTIDFLNSQLKRLLDIKKDMDSYYSIASSPNSYNKYSRQFTPQLKAFYDREPYTDEPDSVPWIKTPAVLLDVITSLATIPYLAMMQGRRFLNFINPDTGTLEGINALIQLIDMLINQLTFILGRKIHLQSPGNELKRQIYSTFKASIISVTRYFNEMWDSNKHGQIGLDYLGTDGLADAIGLKTVTRDAFKERIELETAKYFKNSNSVANQSALEHSDELGNVSKQMGPMGKFESMSYRYVAPATAIDPTRGWSVDMLNQGSNLFENNKYLAMTTNILLQQGGNPTLASVTDTKDAFGVNGVGNIAIEALMGQLNCTVVANGPTQYDLTTDEEYSSDLLTVGTILGSEDLEVRQDLGDMGSPACEEDTILEIQKNQNSAFTPLSVLIIQNLAVNASLDERIKTVSKPAGASAPSDSPFVSGPKIKIRDFDLNAAGNVVDNLFASETPTSEIFTPGIEAANQDIQQFDLIPNQTNSLILSKSPLMINNFLDMDFDVIRNVQTSEFFRFNYTMLQEIEVFIGYNKNGRNLNLMMAPRWVPLQEYGGLANRLKNLTNSKMLLCRFKKYNNQILGIGTSNGLDVGVFDKYFLISKVNNQPRRTPQQQLASQNSLGLANNSVGAQVVIDLLNLEYPDIPGDPIAKCTIGFIPPLTPEIPI